MPARMSAKKLPAPLPKTATSKVSVCNKLGLHARPASLFVRTANRFQSEVFVEKDGEVINGKSIMGLLMLAAGPGSQLILRAEGTDASQAVSELETLVRRKFDED
jgi:phosphocarrier protein HPr